MYTCIIRETFVFTVFRRVFHSILKLELCRHACRRRDQIIPTCRYGKNMPTTALAEMSWSEISDGTAPPCSPPVTSLPTLSMDVTSCRVFTMRAITFNASFYISHVFFCEHSFCEHQTARAFLAVPNIKGIPYTPLFMSVKRLPVKDYHNCSP